MATMKIKKDDMVQVIAGKDKGKEGKVLSVDAKNNKVLVEGVNIVHKHSKPSMQNQQGGEMPGYHLCPFHSFLPFLLS